MDKEIKEKLTIQYNYSNKDLKLSDNDFFEYVKNQVYIVIDELAKIFEITDRSIEALKEHASSSIELESRDPLITYFDVYFWNDLCLCINFAYNYLNDVELLENLANDPYFGETNLEYFNEFKSASKFEKTIIVGKLLNFVK